MLIIVSAHPYCTRKFTCHVIHEHVLSNKMNNDRQMAIAIAFPGFNNLARTMTPVFLLMDHYFSLPIFCL